jgi:hypothetical protein
MAKTRVNLVHRALKNLGVLPAGQTPSDDEYNAIDDHVEPMLARLDALDIVQVVDPDSIDDEVFLPLGDILADTCKSEFGASQDQNLLALRVAAERDLRIMSATRPTYKVLAVEGY